ncbi:ATP-binding cassette domain-containing protein [Ensifer sp. T173]|uniref:ATP-binding cassette domain-containing protein n=1 Tax=Ensifer canadensis TaxID=555315 RepID=A0AAW4FV83_9HYPH|nr:MULTISPECIES: ABC transporter ATP-binding protein [Ensifer]MBM3095210.1 ATP-binding cassette domain-containing protein [Ensifer canadensis]UBI80100.1 ABC transporter ATP-binding protein [Ensifer canadensis]
MSASQSGVELRSLVCRYGPVEAVRKMDLVIEPGEFFTLLGPSGCGKSTTLQAIGGFAPPAAGRILVGGQDITGLPPARRPTNYVFQNYALFPHMSVAENVEYGLKRRKVPAAERRARVLAELKRVGMQDFATRWPAQLSGGQQQRVALARALVNRPAVLLLDEPLSALDFLMRKQLREELKTIQREVGTTTVFVTHDQSEALSMSDRIAVMNAGRIEQIGTPSEIYERPKTRFVAEFVGSANLLPGRVGASGSAVALDAGITLRLASSRVCEGQRCLVMVRPEHMWLTDTGGLTATLAKCTYVGDHHEIVATLAHGGELTIKQREWPSLAPGALCHIAFDETKVHVIPAS